MPRRVGVNRAGILEVAALAGVSRQTVTRAINDMPGISAETKQKVLDAAEKLRYRPSRFGRELVRESSRSVGLVVSDLANPFFAELASELAKVASTHDWNLIVVETNPRSPRYTEKLQMLARHVDAAIAYVHLPPEDIDAAFQNVPLVLLDAADSILDGLAPSRPRAALNIEIEPGLTQAIDHLVSAGRTSIALVDVDYGDGASDRTAVFTRLIEQRDGIDGRTVLLHAGGDDLELGRRAVEIALEAAQPPDAIVAYNDMSAFGVIKELRVRGFRVPEDCAVVGIDGLTVGTYFEPELTTLRLDFSAFARTAFDLLEHLAAVPLDAPLLQVRRRLPQQLVVRRSS